MELGVIGLGRMGSNIVRRLVDGGHSCVVYDVDASAVSELSELEQVSGVASLAELAGALTPPRAVWIMIPAELTGDTVRAAVEHLDPGDVLIDGGNSHFREAMEHSERLGRSGIDFCDVGTSGGVMGLGRGYCLMVGGRAETVHRLSPIFDTLAPDVDAAERTPGRSGDPEPGERGWLHCGPSGAGHFVKMVHNGIEYGMMRAYAEGFAILDRVGGSSSSESPRADPADPTSFPGYRFDIDVPAVAELWRRGSVIGSWLLDLTAAALVEDPGLEGFEGRVPDSGEGRWTVQTAVELGVPAEVIASALFSRFSSRGEDQYAGKVLSAMRRQFGGHTEAGAREGTS
jgi:6-phosphogluconate dehydrogenase